MFDRAFGALLRLYPAGVRDHHGDEMREAFQQACAQARRRGGWPAAARTMLAELADLARGAVRVRTGFPRIPSGGRPEDARVEGRVAMSLGTDLRQAIRALRANPGTTALAVSLLALAIAACTAVFTVADAVIFTPVPYRNAERLVPIGIARTPGAWPSLNVTPDLIRAWQDSGAFERIEAHSSLRGTTLDDGIEPRTVPQSWITPGTLDLLGVAPLRGRAFGVEDARQTVPPALISETLWQSQFGGDEAIVGRHVSIEGKPTEIIGVMPAHFRFPLGRRGLWRPLDVSRAGAQGLRVWALGLLRADMPREESLRRADEAARLTAPALLKTPAAVAFAPALGLRSFDQYTVNTVKVLFAGVVLVLLVACVNVANLLLAQALARRRERAVRAALGASRARLIRQALCESGMLALAAAAGGLLLSWLAVSSFESLLPEYVMQRGANGIDVDARAFGLVILLTVVVMLASGLLPAWFGTRVTAGSALKEDARGASEGRGARRLSFALVVSEIAVAVALLVSASLLVRSFIGLATAERGIDTRGIVSVWVGLPEYQETNAERRMALAGEIQERLSALLPGVVQVMRLHSAPPEGADIHFGTLRTDDGRTVEGLEVFGFHATPDFFGFFRMKLVAGRFLSAGDPQQAVVVSESLARALWPGVTSPVGRTFRIGSGGPREVVGVSVEMLTPLMDPRLDRPEFFEPVQGTPTSRYVLRLSDGSAVRADQIKAVVRSVHPAYLVHEVAPIDEQYREQIEGPETAALVATSFAAFGMLVCAAGLFSVLSLSVARRRREFGIRLAIGARPSHVSQLVMRQTAITLTVGIALGVAGAFALTRNLSAVLAGVDVTDAPSWIAVIAIIAFAGVAAAWLPVRDARRTDPLLLLREE